MAVFKCKMCGANLEISEGLSVVTCEYCNTQQTLPKIDNEKKLALFNRANNLRFKSEFDKAAGIYESIITEFSDEAEAYWGLVLCKYGIEYVDDKDGRKIPTCHRTLPTPIMKDEDFQQACEYADSTAKNLYREEAKTIDGIQKKILEIAATEQPYDIFICYKETDDSTGARTEDSSIAQDIYTAFTEKGYKVFYARNSLRKVAGTEYEPYIYAALSSAKVMLAIGTKYEYYDAVWVKNEWSRFISMMVDDSSKTLIPCYKNMDAYDIPEEFSNMQALDMADMMFFNNLEESVKRVAPLKQISTVQETPSVNSGSGATVDSLLKRAFMFLEDGDFARADELSETILNANPEFAEAYLVKLMVDLKVSQKYNLQYTEKKFDDNVNYKKIIRFGNVDLVSELNGYLNIIQGRIDKKRDEKRKECAMFSSLVSSSRSHSLGLTVLGTVLSSEVNTSDYCTVALWEDIVAVSAGYNFSVGLKSDGTVVAVGKNESGQCNVSGWRNIVTISAGDKHIVGLKHDSNLVCAGDNSHGQCNVFGWTDIIDVSAGNKHTVGLKSDGRVVAIGDNTYGQCNVFDWKEIVAISAGLDCTVGLKSDGTVVAAGNNADSLCNGVFNAEKWTDIVAISAGESQIICLKSDGTVVCNVVTPFGCIEISLGWKDVVAVFSGASGSVFGLKSDGSVVSNKKNNTITAWKLFNSAKNIQREREMAREEKRIVDEKKATEMRKTEEANRLHEQRQATYCSRGLCQYCGGELKGLFSKKCVKCGKPKDY